MIKKILQITLMSALLLAVPVQMQAVSSIEIVDVDVPVITLTVNSSTLHVTGAAGQTLYIYNVAGVCVQNFKVDGPDKRYELNLTKGCYIVKVGKTVRKISIK